MELSEIQEKLLADLSNFIVNWRSKKGILSGELKGDNLINFVSDLQAEIKNKVSMEGKSGQTLLLYTGASADTGNMLYLELPEFCKINSDYYYITSTDCG